MADKEDLASKRTDWAEDRTDWAEDRTILANERTFAGWMRTAMACLAVALGSRALFREFEPGWVARLLAELLVLVALFIIWSAYRRAAHVQSRLNQHQAESPPQTALALIAGLMALGAAGAGALLWWL